MTTICEGRVVGDEETLLSVRLSHDGKAIGEHRGDAPFTLEDDAGKRLSVSTSGAEILGGERVSGKWSELKERPHAKLVAKSAPGPHLTVELEVASLSEGDRVAVVVTDIDESLRSDDYRGEGAKVVRAARATVVALGEDGRAKLEKRAGAAAKKAAKRSEPAKEQVRTSPRGIRRFYLGYPVFALASLFMGFVPDASGAWERVLGLTLATFFLGLTLMDVSGVHFPPRFRMGGDGGMKTEGGHWRRGKLKSSLPWSMRWYVWPYLLVQVIVLFSTPINYQLAGTNVSLGLTLSGLATLALGAGLLYRAWRFVKIARLVLAAPPASGDGDLAFVQGLARGGGQIRRLHSSFYLMPAQQHDGTTEHLLTVKNTYDHAARFEIERADGTRVAVENAAGALWTSLDRIVVDDDKGHRVLTETIADGSSVLVVGPFENGAIRGRGPESVFLFGAKNGEARSALESAIPKTLAPAICAILLALASLASALLFSA